jgi:hypothetical protein
MFGAEMTEISAVAIEVNLKRVIMRKKIEWRPVKCQIVGGRPPCCIHYATSEARMPQKERGIHI